MTITRRAVLTGGLGLAFLPLRPRLASAQAAAPVREFTPIAGPLHRFRNNFHYSVFVATPGRRHRHRPDQRRRRPLAEGRDRQALRPAGPLPDLQPRPRRPHLGRRGLRRHRPGRGPRERPAARSSPRSGPTAVPQVTFSDRMVDRAGGHGGRALARRPEPLRQLDRDAVPEGAALCSPSTSSR